MSTIYIVTDGDYDDYHICAVFSERENAEAYIERAIAGSDYFRGWIEEYELDEKMKYVNLPKEYKTYTVRFAKDGTVLRLINSTLDITCETSVSIQHNGERIVFDVKAKTDEEAVQLAREAVKEKIGGAE